MKIQKRQIKILIFVGIISVILYNTRRSVNKTILTYTDQFYDRGRFNYSRYENELMEWRKLTTSLHQHLCLPKCNIVFLKTHKSGSSTIQNILLRFAEKNNLTIALPPKKMYQLGYPRLFQREYVIDVPWKEYNILTHHTRFDLHGT
ncbi:galactose-3-O-sulfotransferase 2-like, partial [Saccoglossus kowalevskii]|uniref:Galactose-3-O-sulfotransferase 2-like n=1 Tax=Saccoglossus kowalevskii TaxID=10224 RepID=A0ABM0MEM4_SACKO